MYEKQEAMENDMECLRKEINAVKYIVDATQKDSQSVCGRIVACETRIKEIRKQMQPDVLWETIVTKHENKLKDEMDSALQLMTARQDDKLKQEMDSVLETVNKDIANVNGTLAKVKQEEKLRESKVCNIIIYKVSETNNHNRTGFIKGRSTSLQLLKILDKWTELLENGGQIDVIYTDLEKAFDKIPHKRLINKLFSYGLNNKDIISWIEAFLNNRKQRVRISRPNFTFSRTCNPAGRKTHVWTTE